MADSRHTFLITGASGFLGRYFSAECMRLGCYDLRLLTRNRSTLEHLGGGSTTVVEGDLLKPETLKDFLLPGGTVVHLAYMMHRHDANIKATMNLIDAINQSQIQRVIYTSTATVVGFYSRGVITEETTPVPVGTYQQTKRGIEEMLIANLHKGIELAILRPTEIIGLGGEGLRSMIARLQSEKILRKLIYHTILKYRRFNYVSVHNVVAALMILATSPTARNGEIYNISDDDDPENNYAAVEKIINVLLHKKHGYWFDIGLPPVLLSLIFRLLPHLSPPDRVYSCAKISALGYRKVATLHSTISELLLQEKNRRNSE